MRTLLLTHVDSFTKEAMSCNTERTETDALTLEATEVQVTLQHLATSSCLCGHSAAKYIKTQQYLKKNPPGDTLAAFH